MIKMGYSISKHTLTRRLNDQSEFDSVAVEKSHNLEKKNTVKQKNKTKNAFLAQLQFEFCRVLSYRIPGCVMDASITIFKQILKV